MSKSETIILGGGMTGLAAGYVSNIRVFEAELVPGGICSSYYIKPNESRLYYKEPEDKEAYRFEIGVGHWIFGILNVKWRWGTTLRISSHSHSRIQSPVSDDRRDRNAFAYKRIQSRYSRPQLRIT